MNQRCWDAMLIFFVPCKLYNNRILQTLVHRICYAFKLFTLALRNGYIS